MINNDAVVEWRKICSHCQSEFVDKMFRPFHMRVRDFKEAPGTCKQCYKKRSEELKNSGTLQVCIGRLIALKNILKITLHMKDKSF